MFYGLIECIGALQISKDNQSTEHFRRTINPWNTFEGQSIHRTLSKDNQSTEHFRRTINPRNTMNSPTAFHKDVEGTLSVMEMRV